MSELILAIGDENVEFQNLDQCSTNVDWTASKGARITFGSQQPITMDGTKKLGLILWLDREKVAAAIKRAQKGAK